MSFFQKKSDEIFRQSAVDSLASPEQIDRLDILVPTQSWFLLLGFILFIGLGLFWGIYGKIPTTLKANGILLTTGGVSNIPSSGSGILSKFNVKPEQIVKKGEILAEIKHPELRKEIESAQDRLVELKARRQMTLALQQNELKSHDYILRKRQLAHLDMIKTLKIQKKWVLDRIDQQQKLQAKGLITNQVLLNTQRERQDIDGQIREKKNQRKQMHAETQNLLNRHAREDMQNKAEISEAGRKIELLEKRIEVTSRVIAPESGRILEIMVSEGDLVSTGQSILSLEIRASGQTNNLQAFLYIPMREGKQLKLGMDIQLVPGSVKRQEFGFIQAKVLSVSAFPATHQGMVSVLGNAALVKQLTIDGPPLAVIATLRRDISCVSGYKWSSGSGPDMVITSGTSCDASIVVREQTPISLVIPILTKYAGF